MTRRSLCFALLFVLPPSLKPSALRLLVRARVGRHVRIGWFSSISGADVSLGDYTVVSPLTVIQCDQGVSIGAYSQVSSFTLIYGSARFVLGDHSYVGPQSLINADEEVRFGRHTAVGARAVIYTHGSWLPYTEGYWVRFGKVSLGDYVWCAAGVFLHPGVTIGDRVFVNSRSVVTGSVPDDSVVQGNPAVPVSRMEKMRRRMTPARVDETIVEMLRYFAEVELVRARGLTAREVARGRWEVADGRRTWRLIAVPAGGAVPVESGRDDVYIINDAGVRNSLRGGAPVIDFTTMRTTTRNSWIAERLVDFFKRYYGVQFEFEEL